MNYNKCNIYPQCTYSECSCYLTYLFKRNMSGKPIKNNNPQGKKIIGFDIIDGKAIPIFEK